MSSWGLGDAAVQRCGVESGRMAESLMLVATALGSATAEGLQPVSQAGRRSLLMRVALSVRTLPLGTL